jgi:hypothetical protein
MYPRQKSRYDNFGAMAGQKYCLQCNNVYRNAAIIASDICPNCRDDVLTKITVYDRDKRRGQIPMNLKKYIETPEGMAEPCGSGKWRSSFHA